VRRLFGVLVVLPLGLACARPEPSPKPSAAPPLPADVQALSSLAPSQTPASADPPLFEATGEFVSPIRSELVAKNPGRVGKVYVDEGARVQKGQPLLELESDYLKLDADRAQAEVARTQAVEADSKRDFERKSGLLTKGSVSQAVYDRSKSTYDQATAARVAAESASALARQKLADAVLVSPIDGVVLERRADVGQRLGDNTIAFVLVQTAPLKLRFRMPERYLSVVEPGQPVHAKVDPYPDASFDGRVAVVGQAVDPATRSIMVEAEFPNRDGRLRSGLFARVSLATGASQPSR
jgi:membrane fusion protein (multidrug efflux system)